MSPLDATISALALLAMALAGLVATLIPARRATRVSPLIAIQAE